MSTPINKVIFLLCDNDVSLSDKIKVKRYSCIGKIHYRIFE